MNLRTPLAMLVAFCPALFACQADRPILIVANGGAGGTAVGAPGAAGSMQAAAGAAGSMQAATGSAGAAGSAQGAAGMAGNIGIGAAGTGPIQFVINRNVDVLFEIDNSVSMAPEQANLVASFPSFINALKSGAAGLPNLHIGIVTSDMGAGAFTSMVQGCQHPDNGAFVDQIRAATDPVCAGATLNAGQHFIESFSGGTQNNFTGDITDVFRCLAQVGTTGCGFEDHFESLRAALGDAKADPMHDIPVRPIPRNNVGFLRDDALLAVVMITNEEECSAPPDSALWDPSSSALGPLASRCFGHTDICDGVPVINYVGQGTPAGPFKSCVPDETTFATDPTHAAIPVRFYVDYFTRLKDPSKLLLGGIFPPAAPYSLVASPSGTGSQLILQGDSCTGLAGVFGQPTPRLDSFLGGFQSIMPPGVLVQRESICDQSFAAIMQGVAALIEKSIGLPCVRGTVASVMDPTGRHPDCVVVDHTHDAQGNQVDSPVPSCVGTANQPPCWSLVAGAPGCGTEQALEVVRPMGQMVPVDLSTTVGCNVPAP